MHNSVLKLVVRPKYKHIMYVGLYFFLFHFAFDVTALEYTVHQNRVTVEVDHNSFVPATLLVNW